MNSHIHLLLCPVTQYINKHGMQGIGGQDAAASKQRTADTVFMTYLTPKSCPSILLVSRFSVLVLLLNAFE